MPNTHDDTAFAPDDNPKLPRQHKGDSRDLRGSHPPTQTRLGEFRWLDVARLQVDPSYQHKVYTRAVEDLRTSFDPEVSGAILVNQRADGSMWIIDGQTRTEVHRQIGFRWIRAEVLRGLSDEDEARWYLKRCRNIQRVPMDLFLAEYKAGDPLAVLLHKILTERSLTMESFATEYQHRNTHAVITCVATLKRLLRLHDPEAIHLGAALDLIIDTWGYVRGVFGGQFIESIFGLVQQYGDDIDRKSFIAKLGQHDFNQLNQMARGLRLNTTPQPTLRTATQRKIIELYNERRQTGRIGGGA